MSSDAVRTVERKPDEDVRLRLLATTAKGTTNNVTITVKKGGVRKILETESLAELGKAIRTNVTIVGTRQASLQPAGAPTQSQPFRPETDRLPAAAGSDR